MTPTLEAGISHKAMGKKDLAGRFRKVGTGRAKPGGFLSPTTTAHTKTIMSGVCMMKPTTGIGGGGIRTMRKKIRSPCIGANSMRRQKSSPQTRGGKGGRKGQGKTKGK